MFNTRKVFTNAGGKVNVTAPASVSTTNRMLVVRIPLVSSPLTV